MNKTTPMALSTRSVLFPTWVMARAMPGTDHAEDANGNGIGSPLTATGIEFGE
jgi:hypothetical protein